MTRIPSDLARFGLKVELVPGWETRGSSAFAPGCVVDHWTAGPRGTRTRPSLSVVTNGRPGLDGPLCNVYLARDGVCVVVAAGRANHAGAGGFRGLIGNSAAYGIEAESGGDGDWTPEMLDAYPRLNAALLSGLGRDVSWVASHSEWAPDRKIDIRDIIGRVRAQTAVALVTGGSSAAASSLPAPRRRPRDMYLIRDNGTGDKSNIGAVHLVTDHGLRHLNQEEWACFVWLLDDDRDPDADAPRLGIGDTYDQNARFVDVIHAVLARPVDTTV
jgi:hypothetical protein